ncbi:MAG TPA: glycosyltransferase [Blastocatellia bacterium]|nr:glycosyltransferase [Blastocatellia bacterium]
MHSNPRVLYIAYWGAVEPLGQSLVLPAVEKLVEFGASLTLITFEKPADLERAADIERIRDRLKGAGIAWCPLRYHKWPRIPATSFDLAQGWARGIAAGLSSRIDVIHARTFVGGLVGLALAPLLRARLVYHNEGFYPDEQVDGGMWRAGSLPHRIAKNLEQRMYGRSDGIIAMSIRGKQTIEKLQAVSQRETPVIVVPSCVDLDHFDGRRSRLAGHKGLRLVYTGSVGGRYILDRIGRFTRVASEMLGDVQLRVLTRTEPALVTSLLDSSGLDRAAWSVNSVSRDRMPDELANQDAGLFFLTRGLSEHGCSPTKIGEYWAMGLPVVTTANVSDNDEIIRRERVGVIVNDHSDAEYGRALGELQALLKDPELASRCRRAAEEYYALTPACERQFSLYHKVIDGLADVEVTTGGEVGVCPASGMREK